MCAPKGFRDWLSPDGLRRRSLHVLILIFFFSASQAASFGADPDSPPTKSEIVSAWHSREEFWVGYKLQWNETQTFPAHAFMPPSLSATSGLKAFPESDVVAQCPVEYCINRTGFVVNRLSLQPFADVSRLVKRRTSAAFDGKVSLLVYGEPLDEPTSDVLFPYANRHESEPGRGALSSFDFAPALFFSPSFLRLSRPKDGFDIDEIEVVPASGDDGPTIRLKQVTDRLVHELLIDKNSLLPLRYDSWVTGPKQLPFWSCEYRYDSIDVDRPKPASWRLTLFDLQRPSQAALSVTCDSIKSASVDKCANISIPANTVVFGDNPAQKYFVGVDGERLLMPSELNLSYSELKRKMSQSHWASRSLRIALAFVVCVCVVVVVFLKRRANR